MRKVSGVRWSRTKRDTYSVSYSTHHKLLPVSTSVPKGVLDKLDEKARSNGTTIAEEARQALIYATGEYAV